MDVGPIVFWSGGGGSAPPPTFSDKFAPKYLVGNALAGDGNSTSVAGFTYILDPGDGSGIQLALGQPNGSGDVYVRPGTYVPVNPLLLTVPAGVRVVGAGRSATLLTGITFTMQQGSSLEGMTVSFDSGTGITATDPSSNITLTDLLLEVNGAASQGIYFAGPGFINAPFEQPIALNGVQIDITVPGAVGVFADMGSFVTFKNLAISGGGESLRVEGDSAVFGLFGLFSDSSVAGVNCRNGTGSAPVRLEETVILSDISIQLQGKVDSFRFHNCYVIANTAAIEASTGEVTGLVCTGCTFIAPSDIVGLGVSGTNQVIFDSCTFTASNGPCLTLGGSASDITLSSCQFNSNAGPALATTVAVTATGCTFRSSSSYAAEISGTGSNISGCTFISQGSAPQALSVSGTNNVFTGTYVLGPDVGANCSVLITGSGHIFSSLAATITDLVIPNAVSVSGNEVSLTSLRTSTPSALQPGVVFDISSSDNILLGLNARGPSTPIAVTDLGTGNEIAHVVGTNWPT